MQKTAAVIGSGFGGLALAIRLQSAGIATTIFEARERAGGRAYVWEDEGFIFDAGPTVVTDPTCIEELFALSGRRLADYATLLPVSPFYRLLWEDGTRFDYSNDDEKLLAQIAALSPADVGGYQRFMEYSAGVFHEGYEKLGHEAFLDFRSMLEAAPDLIAPFAHQAYLPQPVVFTTGIVDAGDSWLVASGEADLACRMTRISKARLD